jgi:hypothetical protein
MSLRFYRDNCFNNSDRPYILHPSSRKRNMLQAVVVGTGAAAVRPTNSLRQEVRVYWELELRKVVTGCVAFDLLLTVSLVQRFVGSQTTRPLVVVYTSKRRTIMVAFSLIVVSRRPVTADTHVRSQTSACGFCVGQCGTGTGCFPNTSVTSGQYHFTRGCFPITSVISGQYHFTRGCFPITSVISGQYHFTRGCFPITSVISGQYHFTRAPCVSIYYSYTSVTVGIQSGINSVFQPSLSL